MLAKGLDPPQLLLSRSQLPIREQLFTVLRRPLDREAECTRGNVPREHLWAGDRDRDLELPVVSVKVRREMIVKMHPDDDPEESRDLGHLAKVRMDA